MNKVRELLLKFEEMSKNPESQAKKYTEKQIKIIGCFPYYAPEELVIASGMIPFGVWGYNGVANAAKEYFPSFYCSLAQMNLELGLTGKLNYLSGVIVTCMCDTLRPLSQNFRIGVSHIPFIFLAHPQNRRLDCGVEFLLDQYKDIKKKLEEISEKTIKNEDLKKAIKLMNKNRALRRRFIELAGEHPNILTPTLRNYVLKSSYFCEKNEYNSLLEELNSELEKLPKEEWDGIRVVTSGIILDSPNLLKILEENKIAIVADDVAHESRAIKIDVSEEEEDGLKALALQFSNQDYDTLLYDPELNKRPTYISNLVNKNKAQGVIVAMMQFCDPEELEYPSLKAKLKEDNIPHIIIGFDHQMTDFGQAKTMIQTFAELMR